MGRCHKFYFKKFLNEYKLKIKDGRLYLYISFRKIISFVRYCGKYSADRHGTDDYAL